ncbi:bifunctional preprotein translocase subunit SecD/SecF, partial [gut metagenome]
MVLAVVCLWQLSFTLVTKLQENKAEKYADNAIEAIQKTAAFNKVSEADKAFYLDSVKKEKSRWYLDSMSTEKVYFGYTYKDVKEKEINLGLDLKGGMNVTLQVQLEDLVKALSGDNQLPEFTKAIALAKERSVSSRTDFVTLFHEAWKETSGGMRLSQIFGTYEMRDKIKPESTDEQVIDVIRKEAESAISNSFNVLRNRIDRFGVTQPSIQKLGNSGRILVELPGVKEPERVRKLLQGTASLEFWTTYSNSEIFPFLQEANKTLAGILAEENAGETAEAQKTEIADSLLAQALDDQNQQSKEFEEYKRQNPLFAVLNPAMAGGRLANGACIGYANYIDTAKINKWLALPQIESLFP